MTIDTATVQLETKLPTQSLVDKPHIDSQVSVYETMPLITDRVLLPDAEDAPFRAMLVTMRIHIAEHLAQAKTPDGMAVVVVSDPGASPCADLPAS